MSVYTYRRGSIFWALTLIGVGAIFLIQNFNPAIHPWQVIAKFWPILIIFWGVSKLIDYIQAQAHPETTPPPLFSASEVVLLVLILIMGTMISHIVLRPWHTWPNAIGINDEEWANMFMNSYTYTDSLSQPLKPKSQLVIEDQRGDVEIRPSDKPTVDVTVKKIIRADNEEAAKKIADQLKVEIAEEGGHYVLKSNARSLADDGGRISLDLLMSVPKSTSMEITSERGDVTLSGLQGDQTVTAQHGDVHISGIEGLVRVHKTGGLTEARDVKGNVEVDGRGGDIQIADIAGAATVNGDFSGTLEFRNVAQTLRYTSSRTDLTVQRVTGRLDMETGSLDASDIEGPFEISTRQKDITLENFKNSVKITNTNGDVRMSTTTPVSHPIDVKLDKGEIDLSIPPSSNFQIDASSRHGDVETEFASLNVNKEGDNPSISGTAGKGGPAIHLSTSYGTIHLGRDEGSQTSTPSEPTPPKTPRPPKAGEKTFLFPPHVPHHRNWRDARLKHVVVLREPAWTRTQSDLVQ